MQDPTEAQTALRETEAAEPFEAMENTDILMGDAI